MRILLAGDCHGSMQHTTYLFKVAQENHINTIIQLGDFGYWPHVDNYAEQVDKLAVNANIDFFWLDGNHENFDALEKVVDMKSNDPQLMGERLSYLPRGSYHDFGGLKVLVLGGAVSIDKAWRIEQESKRGPQTLWWYQEKTNDLDIKRALSHGKVDIMLTHDMPDETFNTQLALHGGFKADPASQENRKKISYVMDRVRPKELYHGHMHIRYTEYVDGTLITGLANDGHAQDSWTILDTNYYLDKE